MIARKNVFVSTLTYELGRRLGVEAAALEFQRQLAEPSRQSLPVVRLCARLKQLHDVSVYHGFSTSLPKARSRAAHAAWQSKADFWLMCDDDVECNVVALEHLFAAVGDPLEPRAAVLPCLMRGDSQEQQTVNVQWWDGAIDIALPTSTPPIACWTSIRRARLAGTGCMLLSREALCRVIYTFEPELGFRDDDGVGKVALFQTLIEQPSGKWLGEDFSFCERLRVAGVEIYGILTGVSMHAGNALALEALR